MRSFHHNIHIINPDDPPRGGLGRALREIVKALRENGVAVDVSVTSVRLLVCLSARFRTLIVPTGPGGLLCLCKPHADRFIVICYHTYVQQCRSVPGERWKRMFVPLEKRTLCMADEVWCYSECTHWVLENEYGLQNVKLLPQILDIERWVDAPPPGGRGLGGGDTRNGRQAQDFVCHSCVYVGRKDRRKGFHILQQAWKIVEKEISNVELRCVTDGNMPQEELMNRIRSADLVVVPSYLEGFGLVAAEAMAVGTCVIASDCEGLRSLIRHGETGWLVPPGDPHALAGGILHLLRHELLRSALARRAQEDICSRFDRGVAVSTLLGKL